MQTVIGIDVGSSATKVGIFDLEGHECALASRSYPTHEPLPGFKEQDPEQWWAATGDCIRELVAKLPRESIVALGATGHISSFTFTDRAGKPLRPAIGFQDQRAVREVAELYERFSREDLAAHLGIDLPPGATWPLPKLIWVHKHEPDLVAKAYRLLQAKDYINLRLTGEFAGDVSSNRGMVNLADGRPAEAVFRTLGLRSDLLPSMFDPHAAIGRVCPAAAEETGLPKGLPVVCGWNDLNAGVLGTGAVHPGDFFNLTGTSEHVGAVVAQGYRNPSLICAPFLPDTKLLYGVTLCGGGSLDWYARLCGSPIEDLLQCAAAAPLDAEPLLFLPYLEGERSPIWDANAAGAFVGIRTAHEQGHFVRAILEGVAFSLQQILELVEEHAGESKRPVLLSGGAARIGLWNRIKADVFAREIALGRNRHAGVLGAAMLAAVAAGAYSTREEAARAMAQHGETIAPDPTGVMRYQNRYARYCELYPALREVFGRIAAGRGISRVSHD
jgi:xylulokinase